MRYRLVINQRRFEEPFVSIFNVRVVYFLGLFHPEDRDMHLLENVDKSTYTI
jgi:hypothetical protein